MVLKLDNLIKKMKFIKSTLIAITIFCILSFATSRTISKNKSKSKTLMSRVINLYNSYTNAGNGSVSNLGSQNISCPTGSAISYFQLSRGNNTFRYQVKCVSMPGIDLTPVQKYTPWNVHNGAGGSTNFLDRHYINCPSNQVLQQYQLQNSGANIRYSYKCVKAIIKNCYQKQTSWTKGGKNYYFWYLDRQTVSVADTKTQAIQSFRINTKYNDSWFFPSYKVEYRYTFTICTLNEPVPVPLTAQKTKEMTLDSTERAVRRRRY